MRRLGESDRSIRSGTVLGALMILVAFAALGAIALNAFDRVRSPGLDGDLCPADGPVAHLAILLDTTDPLVPAQHQRTRQILDMKIADVPVGTRVSFSTVNPDPGIRERAFRSVCKPPSEDDVSILTENPRMVQERYQEQFLDPIDDAISRLLKVPEAASSPIMESLQEFASRIRGFTTTDRPRELVIMSDLMQHSPAFSFYRGEDWNSFYHANGPERFGLAFSNAAITVLRLPRVVDMAPVVDDFWVRYLMLQGFGDINVISVGDL